MAEKHPAKIEGGEVTQFASTDRLSHEHVSLGVAIVLDHTLTESSSISPASTSEAIAYSYQVPSGEVAAGDTMSITVWTEATSSINNKTWRLYINTSNSLSGATLIGTSVQTTNEGVSTFTRNLFIRSDTTIFSGTAATIDSPGGAGGTTLEGNKTVPSVSAGFWIIISGQKASAGETIKYAAVFITKIKYV